LDLFPLLIRELESSHDRSPENLSLDFTGLPFWPSLFLINVNTSWCTAINNCWISNSWTSKTGFFNG
ncbi:MAG TPA: hypothetical protein PKA06_12520, partial [Gemmatales bacterium]|nr:hypothetical protein [Gemmatales bacterium]